MYFGFGLGDSDEIVKFYPPANNNHVSHSVIYNNKTADMSIDVKLLRLHTILDKLDNNDIDILKMAIEGAEYRVIYDIIKSNIPIGQILIEFHHRFNYPMIKKTKNSIKKLNECGYTVFNISDSGEEYSFIKV